jgi:regulatory protein
MPPKPASIKVRALQWLAQREHSRDELRRKLLRLARGPSVDDETATATRDVDALLDWLSAGGYLSQARFVESRVHAREQRYGNLRIRRELQQHGLGLDAETSKALADSEFERARQVWQRKFGTPAGDAVGRLRQMRFLAGRGFSAEVIRRVVGAARAAHVVDGLDDD